MAGKEKEREIEWGFVNGTREVPGLAAVEVDFGDLDAAEGAMEDLGSEVESDELFVGRVEPEAGWETMLVHIFYCFSRCCFA